MTDDLLEATADAQAGDGNHATTPAAATPEADPGTTGKATPTVGIPDGLPEKFWDAERGVLRTASLVKSYRALEQRLGALGGQGVPTDPGGYDIKVENEIIASDPEVNARLHAAGFNQTQAQTVYDLASEYLMPMVGEVAAEFQAQGQVERLARHFGGDDKWRQTATQLKSWGGAKLPPEVFEALSGTYEGVLAMHRMMQAGEPGLIAGAGAGAESLSEGSLRAMMQDPRYWRDHEPSFIQQVQEGFKKLYPDQG